MSAASDITDDGTQDPTQECNGTSAGFESVTAPASPREPTPVIPFVEPCTAP